MSDSPEEERIPEEIGLEEFRLLNLVAMRRALDDHNSKGCLPARAILLNPIDHQLLPWSVLWGLPVLPDATVRLKRVVIDCPGSARNLEHELKAYTDPLGDEFG